MLRCRCCWQDRSVAPKGRSGGPASNNGRPTAAPSVGFAAVRRRVLVADQLTATTGEDGRTAGETCPLLLAVVDREPSDKTVVWQYAPADRRAVASGGIAEAVGAGKSIQSQEGTEGCLTKPDGKALVSSFGTWVGPCGPCVERGGQPQRENGALDL